MDDYSLILNAGSSSLKFCVYRRTEKSNWTLQTRGQIDGIGTSPQFTAYDGHNQLLTRTKLEAAVRDGRAAIDTLASWLRLNYAGARVSVVGHRVVHGGSRYARPVLVTREVLVDLYQLIPLAPLHQPYNLAAIDKSMERLPDAHQVACFDTSFHQSHSPIAKLVPPSRTATVERVINLLARILFVSFCWKVHHGRLGANQFSRIDTHVPISFDPYLRPGR